MNTAITVGMRELRERSRLFVIAGALAVLPFLVAAMPRVHSDRANVVAMMAGFSAISYAIALATLMGASIVGRELSEKRISFYFTKPLSPVALWAGKVGAALLIVLGVAAIIAIPAVLTVPDQWRTIWGGDDWIVWKVSLAAALFVFFVAHALSTMVRSRSVLVALDFVLAVVTFNAILWIVRPLLFRGAFEIVGWMLLTMGIALLLILAVSPVWQLSRGRADVRRSHAALSRVLWPAIGVLLLVAGAYSAWLSSTSLASIDEVQNLEQSPSGEWVFVTGGDHARQNIPASFLLHTPSGKSERVNTSPWTGVEFSRDGKALVWTESAEALPRRGDIRIHTRALTPGAKPRATDITGHLTDRLALAADGSRIAVLNHQQLRVHDLATGKLVAAASGIDRSAIVAMFFPSPDAVRVIVHLRATLNAEIFEFDLVRKKLRKTGQIPATTGFPWGSMTASENGEWLYVNERIFLDKSATVLDGRTGAVRLQLPYRGDSSRGSVMLNDGRIARVESGMLRLYANHGALLREVKLPIVRGAVIGQAGDSKLVLVGRPTEKSETTIRGRRTLTVDIDRGVVERVVNDVYGPAPASGMDPRLPRYTADATYAGMGTNKKLTQWK